MTKEEYGSQAVRRAYLVLLVVPLVFITTLWAGRGLGDEFARVAYPLVLVGYGVLTIGFLARRLSVRTVGPWVWFAPALVLLSRLLTWEFEVTPPAQRLAEAVAVVALFGVVFALGFLVFGTRTGVRMSVAGWLLLYAGVGWSATFGMLADYDPVELLVLAAGGHAALIAIVWVLARNIERLTAARARTELLELQATTDHLTGLGNRRFLDDEADRLVARAQRYRTPLSLVMIDLDHFKWINDRYGHVRGDRVLETVAERLGATVRDADVLGRWGGEEFLLLAPETDHRDACALAERCRQVIRGTPFDGIEDPVTASLGVTTLGATDDVRELTRRADLALHAAKTDGRDRVVGIPNLADGIGDPVATG